VAELTHHSVTIIGAGPAGLGVASALKRIGVETHIVDRHSIGGSFRHWPDSMRLITPSFTGNQFKLVDLNAITPDTSPALTLGEEHPTGIQYANYLTAVAEMNELDVTTGPNITGITYAGDCFTICADNEPYTTADFVIWAAGERMYPRIGTFDGAELCSHTIDITKWDNQPGSHVLIIGGYESGIDAAVNLVERGRKVTVVDPDAPWDVVDNDPSRALSPYTLGRLRNAYSTGQLTLDESAAITQVNQDRHGYHALNEHGDRFTVFGPPLLATGFIGSITLINDLFAFNDHNRVIVTEDNDESTLTPNLFLAGPAVNHRNASFCFIYKFRQRFGVVANAIGTRMGADVTPLEPLREYGFWLDDLTCCTDCIC